MLAPKPPKEMLVDSVVWKSFEGEGDYNKPIYGDEVAISFVRIDRSPQYQASLSGKVLIGNAKVFCYNGLTDPLPTFKEQDLLIFDGVEHVVTSAPFFKEPFVDQIYSWELVVV